MSHLSRPFVLAVATALLLLPGLLNAATVSINTRIDRIYPQAGGIVIINLVTDHASCTSASSPDHYYLEVNQNGATDLGFQNLYAAALAAMTSQLDVTVWFDDSTSECYISRIRVQQ